MRCSLRPSLHVLVWIALLLPTAAFGQWRKLSVYSNTFFNEVFFYDNNHGWITGFNGTVLRTADAGSTWQSGTLTNSGSSSNRDICFVSASTGFVSGEDGIWKTTNGGATWTSISPSGVNLGGSAGMWFTDANNGVYGFGRCNDSSVTFCRTSDGGTTWSTVKYVSNRVDVAVGGIAYASGTYYAAGGNGHFWKSTDNGASWSESSTGSAGWQEDIYVQSGDIYIASATGMSCQSSGGGKLLKSVDGGSTWSTTNFPTIVMWGVAMYSGTAGWSCGDNGNAFSTNDGGSTWSKMSCGMNSLGRVDDIYFTDASHGWAVGDGIYQYVGDYFVTARDTIDFGDVLVGSSSADSSLNLLAVGGSGIVSSYALGGTDPSEFAFTGGSGSYTLASCRETGTPAKFSPTSEGRKVAYADFTIQGFTPKPRIVLVGRGVKPVLMSSPALIFDTILCGARVQDTVRISNNGSYPLSIDSATVIVPSGGSFRIVRPSLPASIPPGSSTDLVLEATPTGSGQMSSILRLFNNDPEQGKSPWEIKLSGYKRQIDMQFDPDTLVTIPAAPLGDTGRVCIRYHNTGDGTQIIETVKATGNNEPVRLSDSVSMVSLPKFGYQDICFEATAYDTAWHIRKFLVRTQPCGVDTFITVRYKARNPSIQSASVRTFPETGCDGVVFDTIVVTNSGNDLLIVGRPSIKGNDSAEFTVVSPMSWPDSIPIGESFPIIVRFTPIRNTVQHSAALLLPSNDRGPSKSLWSITLNATRKVAELAYDRRTLDLGEICLDSPSFVGAIVASNKGMSGATVTDISKIDADGITRLTGESVFDLGPGKSETIRFECAPDRLGEFHERYLLRYDPCGLSDTVEVVGTVVGIDLASTPTDVDFGVQPPSLTVGRTVMLANQGNATAQIQELYLDPPVSEVSIISPTTSFTLDPGASIPVQLTLSGTTEGIIQSRLVAVSFDPCPDTLYAPIDARISDDPVLASKTDLSLGTILACTSSSPTDSVVLYNRGTAAIAIDSAVLAGGTLSPFSFVRTVSPGTPIAPGDSAVIVVGLSGGGVGELLDTVVVTTGGTTSLTIAVPVHARREAPGLAVTDGSGTTLTSVTFDALDRCHGTAETEIHLRNTGTTTDTIAIASSDQAIAIVGPGTIILGPTRDTIVRLRATASPGNNSSSSVTIVSKPCDIEHEIIATAHILTVETAATGNSFGDISVGEKGDTTVSILNTGEADRTIESVDIVGSPDFTLLDDVDGNAIGPGAERTIRIEYAPSSAGQQTATVRIVLSTPCRDTLYATLMGNAVLEEHYRFTLSAGRAIGRWGTTVDLPIGLHGEQSLPSYPIVVTVTAPPELLEPTGFTASDLVRVEQQGFDPKTGIATYTIAPAREGATLPATDTLMAVRYEVLRGDRIAGDIVPGIVAPARNAIWEMMPGEFALEDYCDAHGRLLRSDGAITLKQNVPNPFNPVTAIEFETAFRDHVTLTVRDLFGHEVARPVDDVLPAGRMRVMFDASGLPSGVYIYELTTGIQVLRHRMVVMK